MAQVPIQRPSTGLRSSLTQRVMTPEYYRNRSTRVSLNAAPLDTSVGHAMNNGRSLASDGIYIDYDGVIDSNAVKANDTTSAVDLEEFCEKHYEKLLPIMADKYEYEKRKKEKLEEVKARLDFGDNRKKSTRAQESAYSESRTISPRRQRRSRSPRHNPSVFTRLRRERSRSPRHEYKSKERRESTVFKRLGGRGRSTSAHSDSRQESSRYTENYSESEDSEGGH
ncbi:hypothetical protein Tco_0298603 [Tanacetum coccineum]